MVCLISAGVIYMLSVIKPTPLTREQLKRVVEENLRKWSETEAKDFMDGYIKYLAKEKVEA